MLPRLTHFGEQSAIKSNDFQKMIEASILVILTQEEAIAIATHAEAALPIAIPLIHRFPKESPIIR